MRLPKASDFPQGEMRRLYLHWTAADYATVFPAYHFCAALDVRGRPAVVATHDLRANMRDVRALPELPYAAHTRGRNSFAIGLSVCGMQAATPQDFGAFPLRDDLLAAACAAARLLCDFYGIPVNAEHVLTHAEAALADGYFGTGDDERWDIARLAPEERALVPADAAAIGDVLRARISA